MPQGALRWALAAWTILIAVGVVLFMLSQSGPPPGHTAVPRTAVPDAVVPAAELRAPGLAPGVTEVATIDTTAPKYSRPGVRTAGSVPSSWWDRPSVLPVLATRSGWVLVRLAQRPNGSTAWVPAQDVTLGTTPYRIVVDLATTHLNLYEDNHLVVSAPAGVGAADDPTPTGNYFVAFDEQPPRPNPGYGPFILVTSAHSPSIANWEGSGDAIIGIHGPLGESAEIGTTGARLSHGCVRLPVQSLQELAPVPPGTPITITN
jgi:lipoprotein-anchoring transpeptidase ErfK/SrfK